CGGQHGTAVPPAGMPRAAPRLGRALREPVAGGRVSVGERRAVHTAGRCAADLGQIAEVGNKPLAVDAQVIGHAVLLVAANTPEHDLHCNDQQELAKWGSSTKNAANKLRGSYPRLATPVGAGLRPAPTYRYSG